LREAVPKLKQVAILSNLGNATVREAVKETEAAARGLSVAVRSFEVVRDPTELDAVFSATLRTRPDALIAIPDPLVLPHRARIAEVAPINRLPAMGGEKAHRSRRCSHLLWRAPRPPSSPAPDSPAGSG